MIRLLTCAVLLQFFACVLSVLPLAIVSTVDGNLHGISLDTGDIAWSIPVTDNSLPTLLSSSLDRIQIYDERDGYVRLIPSFKGELFKWNGESLEQFPTTADLLLSSSTKLTENTFASGAISFHRLAVSLETGKLLYRCHGNGPCKKEGESMREGEEEENETDEGAGSALDEIVSVRSTQRTVRAIDEYTGSERWNFSVTDVEVQYSATQRRAEGIIGYLRPIATPIDSLFDQFKQQEASCGEDPVSLRIMTPEGALFGVDKKSDVLWTRHLNSPIAGVWRYHCRSLVKLDLSDPEIVPDLVASAKSSSETVKDGARPSIYLGSFNNMWYVQVFHTPVESPSTHTPNLSFGHGTNPIFNQARISWVPYLATSPSRTPYLNQDHAVIALDYHSDDFSTALMPINNEIAYPYDAGFPLPQQELEDQKSLGFYFVTDDPKYMFDPISSLRDESGDQFINGYGDVYIPNTETILAFVPVSISYYWKQIAGITVTLALFFNFIYHVYNKHCSKSGKRNSPDRSSESVSTELPLQSADEVIGLNRTTSSFNDTFDYLQKLGKGGFGQVYVARHKLDLQKYAIKRIELPKNEESAIKMRREVLALSRLNHTNIVRYYNSWEEVQELNALDFLAGLNSPDSGTENTSYATNVKNNNVNLDYIVSHTFARNHETSIDEKGDEDSESRVHNRYLSSYSETSGDDLIKFEASNPINSTGVRNRTECNTNAAVFESTQLSPSPTSFDMKIPSQRTSKSYLYIQMELCRPNTLKEWLMDEIDRDRDMSLHIFHQILDAVTYLHSAGQFHRDLKPSNIFFSEREALVKVGDFGLVTASLESQLESQEYPDHLLQTQQSSSTCELSTYHKSSSTSESLKHTSRVGTKIYMSPEQRKGKPYDNKVDIYALGIILYELLQPFATESERIARLKAIRNFEFPQIDAPDPNAIYTEIDLSLVKIMLSQDPCKRPTAEELLAHDILRSYVIPSSTTRIQKLSMSKSRSSSNMESNSSSGI